MQFISDIGTLFGNNKTIAVILSLFSLSEKKVFDTISDMHSTAEFDVNAVCVEIPSLLRILTIHATLAKIEEVTLFPPFASAKRVRIVLISQ